VLVTAAVLIAVFLAVNWRPLATPLSLSFLFWKTEIPVGLAILGLLGLAAIAFAVSVSLWQRSVLAEYRRQAKDLETQRALAASAEASRFTELSALLRSEIAGLDQRLTGAIEALRVEVRQTENSIAATLGEMDDRMQRGSLPPR
jgi:uncharacterized integral membrane protein